MSWFDSLGIKTVDEAVAKLSPLTNDIVTRLRQVVYESEERLNGAEIIIPEIRIKIILPPVSPPGVSK